MTEKPITDRDKMRAKQARDAVAAYEAWRQHGFDGAAGPATSDNGAL